MTTVQQLDIFNFTDVQASCVAELRIWNRFDPSLVFFGPAVTFSSKRRMGILWSKVWSMHLVAASKVASRYHIALACIGGMYAMTLLNKELVNGYSIFTSAPRCRLSQTNVSKRVPKTIQMEPKGLQKGTKVSKSCSTIKPWSVRHCRFFTVSFFRVRCKNGHGALVGLTCVEKVVSSTCRSHISKR